MSKQKPESGKFIVRKQRSKMHKTGFIIGCCQRRGKCLSSLVDGDQAALQIVCLTPAIQCPKEEKKAVIKSEDQKNLYEVLRVKASHGHLVII